MMQFYPFFGIPNFRKYYRYPPKPNFPYSSRPSCFGATQDDIKNNSKNPLSNNAAHCSSPNIFSKQEVPSNCNDSSFKNRDSDEHFFDFFGIRLASDDLLILALLFFLYKEETKDPYLYIALILLLLS